MRGNSKRTDIAVACYRGAGSHRGFRWRWYEGPPIDWDVLERSGAQAPKDSPRETMTELEKGLGRTTGTSEEGSGDSSSNGDYADGTSAGGSRRCPAGRLSVEVEQICPVTGLVVGRYPSQGAAARAMRVWPAQISYCVRRITP